MTPDEADRDDDTRALWLALGVGAVGVAVLLVLGFYGLMRAVLAAAP